MIFMKYFDVPADFKKETIDGYYNLNQSYADSKVIETYGECTIGNGLGSGRPRDMVPMIDLKELEKYVEYSRKREIDFNYILNATCLGNKEFTEEGIREINLLLKRLYEMGIDTITVAMPSLIEIIKLSPYPFHIKASTLCHITNANKAITYKNMGVDRIVVDECLNRDFAKIKQIREAYGEKVELIINVICHRDCIYRPFHQNQCSHDNYSGQNSTTFYPHRCMLKRVEEPGNMLRLGWIRPEDMNLYNQCGVEYFKIQGRHTVLKGDPVRTVKCYLDESFDGNLFELLDCFSLTNSFNTYLDNKKLDGYIKPFWEHQGFCKNDCSNCHYCDKFVEKCIDLEEAKKKKSMAEEFYKGYDQFSTTVSKVNEEIVSSKEKDILKDMEFNF